MNTITPFSPQLSADRQEPASELLELSRAEALELVATGHVGRLAVNLAHHEVPLIRPINYVFDAPSQSVVFRTGAGSKLHALVNARMAAFEVDELDHEMRTGWSVIVCGHVEQITSPAEVDRIAERMSNPWVPGAKAYWLRLRALTVTGRRIVPAEDLIVGYRAE